MALRNPEQAKLLQPKRAPVRKHRNKPITVAGIRFDSHAEAARFLQLKMLAKAGKIFGLAVKPVYKLASGTIKFIPDFEYTENGETITEDVKGGPETQVFKLKAKLFFQETGRRVKIVRLERKHIELQLAAFAGARDMLATNNTMRLS